MNVPYTWLSIHTDNPARGRWDQAWIERILSGKEGSPSVPVCFNEGAVYGRGGLVVVPCGHYPETGTTDEALSVLRDWIDATPWLIIVATSDECALFPWHRLDIPDRVRLWVQTPSPHVEYPPNTRFLPLGAPPLDPHPAIAALNSGKTVDVGFYGQINHSSREAMVSSLFNQLDDPVVAHLARSGGFAQGFERSEYLDRMADTWIAPAPAGPCTPDSFRLYEALEAQCIPIVERTGPDGRGAGYWDMVGLGDVMPIVDSWDEGRRFVLGAFREPQRTASLIQSRWVQAKRRIVRRIYADAATLSAEADRTATRNITVIIPTSPIPSHPSPSVIIETIESVLDRLPNVDILVTCDGVRNEQEHRRGDYEQYIAILQATMAAHPNVDVIVHSEHMHQSGMLRDALDRTASDFVLYVEHDTPLVGDIDFDAVVETMDDFGLNLMRFHHDVSIHEQSAHLYMETEPSAGPFLRTVQWSQRPHLARRHWYNEIAFTYFGSKSRTMIEDVMHSVIQHGHTGNPTAVRKGCLRWGLAVWAAHPDNIKHSGHADGRGSDPKYPMYQEYDGERVAAAPPEGWFG